MDILSGMFKPRYIFCLFFLISGCVSKDNEVANSNSDPPENVASLTSLYAYTDSIENSEPAFEISFTEVQVFDSLLFDGGLLTPRHVMAVDDMGHLFIGAGERIDVYKPTGEFLTSIGRMGSGPGEFQDDIVVQPKTHSGLLFAANEPLQRINVYSLDTFEPIDAILFSPDNWAHVEELNGRRIDYETYFLIDDSTLLMGFKEHLPFEVFREGGKDVGFTTSKSNILYYPFDLEGNMLSTPRFELEIIMLSKDIVSFRNRVENDLFPFMRGELMTVSRNGNIYLGDIDNFLVKAFDSEGNYSHAFYYPHKKQVVDREAIFQTYLSGRVEDDYRNLEFPETLPAFDDMFVDDEERLWVYKITGYEDRTQQWWVFDTEGKLLTKFMWPEESFDELFYPLKKIRMVKDDHLYAVEPYNLDGFTAQRIIKYRIDLTLLND